MVAKLKPLQIDEIEARLARITDPSLVPMVRRALTERAMETPMQRRRREKVVMQAVREIQDEVAALPLLDHRSTREIQDELNQDILDSHR